MLFNIDVWRDERYMERKAQALGLHNYSQRFVWMHRRDLMPTNQILTRSKLKKIKQLLMAQHALQQCKELMNYIHLDHSRLKAYTSLMPESQGVWF